MDVSRRKCFFLLILFFYNLTAFADANNSLVGLWQTYDLSGTPRSIVQFYEADGEYRAKIVEILDKNSKPTLCTKCNDVNKDKPLIGLTIIDGLKPKNDKWIGGKVLDVDSGKKYHCRVSLDSSAHLMHFHVYVAFELLGKTIDWERVK